MEFPRHVCSREGNAVPLKQSEEDKSQIILHFSSLFSLHVGFFYLRIICNVELPLIFPARGLHLPPVFRFLYPVSWLQFAHTYKPSICSCMGVGIWLPALQIQCALLHEHEEEEEYCCFSWFLLQCVCVSSLANISAKGRAVRTIT